MRKQSYSSTSEGGICGGEPLIVVEESTVDEEEAESRLNDSPPRVIDPDSPSLNPHLLLPWGVIRKHSLPTPQCTSGITASQVRRLSEQGESSGPSPKEVAFLATLSQAPTPQPGGRRHSVVTISKVPPILFGRNRRESIAAFPCGGATRILSNGRDSTSGLSGPGSNSGSMHNMQLDIMDNIAQFKAKKVRMKMYKTPSQERVCEIEPLDGTRATERYTRFEKRRLSQTSKGAGSSGAAGIVCSNNDLISILSSLTSSATEINRCGEEATTSKDESKLNWSNKSPDQKRNKLKSFRSNSFDVSILNGTKEKQFSALSKNSVPSALDLSNWLTKRHQPMSKKQESETSEPPSILNFKFDKSKVVKAVKDTLGKTAASLEIKQKVIWDDTSGTKVDAQVLGAAIEKILTVQRL